MAGKALRRGEGVSFDVAEGEFEIEIEGCGAHVHVSAMCSLFHFVPFIINRHFLTKA